LNRGKAKQLLYERSQKMDDCLEVVKKLNEEFKERIKEIEEEEKREENEK